MDENKKLFKDLEEEKEELKRQIEDIEVKQRLYHFRNEGIRDEAKKYCEGLDKRIVQCFGINRALMYFPNQIEAVDIGHYKITTYYTPVKNDMPPGRNYYQDYAINCMGDCRVTSSGYYLNQEDQFKILACPPNFSFGQNLKIETKEGETIYARCEDRGGAIKGKRLDLWCGLGSQAWIGKHSGWAKVYKIS